MINHYAISGACNTTFNEELNDYVFDIIIFYFASTDDSTDPKKTVSTQYQLELSKPNPSNFIACKDVDRETINQWVNDAVEHSKQRFIDVNLDKLAKL